MNHINYQSILDNSIDCCGAGWLGLSPHEPYPMTLKEGPDWRVRMIKAGEPPEGLTHQAQDSDTAANLMRTFNIEMAERGPSNMQ